MRSPSRVSPIRASFVLSGLLGLALVSSPALAQHNSRQWNHHSDRPNYRSGGHGDRWIAGAVVAGVLGGLVYDAVQGNNAYYQPVPSYQPYGYTPYPSYGYPDQTVIYQNSPSPIIYYPAPRVIYRSAYPPPPTVIYRSRGW